MKIKAHVLITNPVDFINHQQPNSISLYYSDMSCVFKGSVSLGERYIDLGDVDMEIMYQKALESLDSAETKLRADYQVAIDKIQTEKQNLLSITHQEG